MATASQRFLPIEIAPEVWADALAERRSLPLTGYVEGQVLFSVASAPTSGLALVWVEEYDLFLLANYDHQTVLVYVSFFEREEKNVHHGASVRSDEEQFLATSFDWHADLLQYIVTQLAGHYHLHTRRITSHRYTETGIYGVEIDLVNLSQTPAWTQVDGTSRMLLFAADLGRVCEMLDFSIASIRPVSGWQQIALHFCNPANSHRRKEDSL